MKHMLIFKVIIATVVMLCAFTAHMEAQNLPVMTYGGVHDDRAYALVEASDTGYVLAGWTRSFGPGTPAFTNVLIIKTDTLGIPQWARITLGEDDDEAYSMTRTTDGGYAITGWTKSYGTNSPTHSNIFVIKLNANGVYQWGWVYSELPTEPASNEEAYSIIQTQDGGYAVTGWTDMAGTHDIFLLKLTPGGANQWFKIYWFPVVGPDDEGYSVCETSDPNIRYLIAGRSNIWVAPPWFDAFVLGVDQFGNPVPGFWPSVISGQYHDQAYSVAWDGAAGVYIAAGWTSNTSSGTPDILIWQATTGGLFIRGRTYGWDTADEIVMDDRSLILTADTGYAVAGWTNSIGPGAPPWPNFLIMRFDTSLNLRSSKVHPSLPGALTEEAYPMIQALNRNHVVAGWTDSYCVGGVGDADFHFLTLDSQGDRPQCVIDTAPPYEEVVGDIELFNVDSFPLQPDSIPIMDTVVEYTRICTLIVDIGETPEHLSPNDFEVYATFSHIILRLRTSGRLDVDLYDVSGRNVAPLAHGMFEKGTHLFTLPKNMSAGIYFVRAELGGIKRSVKFVRLR